MRRKLPLTGNIDCLKLNFILIDLLSYLGRKVFVNGIVSDDVGDFTCVHPTEQTVDGYHGYEDNKKNYANDIAQKLSAFFISDKELKHFKCYLANGCPKCDNHLPSQNLFSLLTASQFLIA